jgi:dolichol-phosphate mannosyltransferase
MDPLFSVIIPARNEAKNISKTVSLLTSVLEREKVPFEIICVNDHSEDDTAEVIRGLFRKDCRVRLTDNTGRPGFGMTVRKGLEEFKGDYCVIFMADVSDSPEDLIKYYRKALEGYDCVFGNRFCRQAKVVNYPFFKLILNRLANLFIKIIFWIPYADVTNAFKCYSRQVIQGMKPLISCHFNLTVEMPLKAIIRGYRWTVIPTKWTGRKKGFSKWKIKEMGSRYLFIIIYLWLEKILSRGDYHRFQNENTDNQ